jgi:hypothetical protein
MRVNTLCVQVITSKSQARGLRMYRDDLVKALGISGVSEAIYANIRVMIAQCNESLSKVPATWAMSHGELCALGTI